MAAKDWLKALKTWRELNARLHEFDEAEVLKMLEHELEHQRRVVVIERLHQRYSTLRAARERSEIMRTVK